MPEHNSSLNKRPCPACGSVAGKYKGEKSGFHLFTCRSCGTLHTSSLPSAQDAKNYDDYYVPENLAIPEFINKRLDEIIASFSSYRQNNRLLDLGCGTGVLMHAAARAGWEAEGVEISAAAVEYVRKQGYGKVFCGKLDEASYPSNHFDVIASSEVLEHVDDPQGFVREVARVLRPGGLFWATTPHGRGVSAKLLGLKWSIVVPPDHLHLFSVAGVRSLLKAAGFRRIRIATHAVNPYELLEGLRHPAKIQESDTDLLNKERIQSSYGLNEFLSASRSRQILRDMVNGLLATTRLGDDLKIRAEK
jgi:2-polyprenyl-3-methyl-5-hydroxy-6-metoxy-1,4-benzoquinol methylase